jgi:hypothetical protein
VGCRSLSRCLSLLFGTKPALPWLGHRFVRNLGFDQSFASDRPSVQRIAPHRAGEIDPAAPQCVCRDLPRFIAREQLSQLLS